MYQLKENSIIRLSDNAIIPIASDNKDYQEYLDWLAEGNTPRPIKPPFATQWDNENEVWLIDETAQKEHFITLLWGNYKDYQHKYVDPEDLTLATRLETLGNEKGKSVAKWAQDLWMLYYAEKAKIEIGDFDNVDFLPDRHGEPLYTIYELNIELLNLTAQEN